MLKPPPAAAWALATLNGRAEPRPVLSSVGSNPRAGVRQGPRPRLVGPERQVSGPNPCESPQTCSINNAPKAGPSLLSPCKQAQVATRDEPPHTREVAGSNPAAPTGRSPQRERDCGRSAGVRGSVRVPFPHRTCTWDGIHPLGRAAPHYRPIPNRVGTRPDRSRFRGESCSRDALARAGLPHQGYDRRGSVPAGC